MSGDLIQATNETHFWSLHRYYIKMRYLYLLTLLSFLLIKTTYCNSMVDLCPVLHYRLFGFITRSRSDGPASYACHVFECDKSGDEVSLTQHRFTCINIWMYWVIMKNK